MTKQTWKGLAVVAAMLLSVGLMTQTVFAAATVTQQATGTVWLGTDVAPAPDDYQALGTNLVITESAPAQFGLGSTLTLTLPTGWACNPASPPSVSGTNGLAGTAVCVA